MNDKYIAELRQKVVDIDAQIERLRIERGVWAGALKTAEKYVVSESSDAVAQTPMRENKPVIRIALGNHREQDSFLIPSGQVDGEQEVDHHPRATVAGPILDLIRKNPGIKSRALIDEIEPQVAQGKNPRKNISAALWALTKARKVVRDEQGRLYLPIPQ